MKYEFKSYQCVPPVPTIKYKTVTAYHPHRMGPVGKSFCPMCQQEFTKHSNLVRHNRRHHITHDNFIADWYNMQVEIKSKFALMEKAESPLRLIPLYGNMCFDVKYQFLVNEMYYERISKHSWILESSGCIYATIEKEKKYLSDFIHAIGKDRKLQHLFNNNFFDYTLLACKTFGKKELDDDDETKHEKYYGVRYRPDVDLWEAFYQKHCEKKYHIGFYKTSLEAAKERDKIVFPIWGFNAFLNFFLDFV